jgi:hypothetical protein
MRVGGLQRISTPDGYFPLDIIDELPHLDLRPYTDDEWDDPNIPHVVMTSDDDWDPGCLDCTISDDMRWYHTTSDMERVINPFDKLVTTAIARADLPIISKPLNMMALTSTWLHIQSALHTCVGIYTNLRPKSGIMFCYVPSYFYGIPRPQSNSLTKTPPCMHDVVLNLGLPSAIPTNHHSPCLTFSAVMNLSLPTPLYPRSPLSMVTPLPKSLSAVIHMSSTFSHA